MERMERVQDAMKTTIEITLAEVAALKLLFDEVTGDQRNLDSKRLSAALSVLDLTLCRGMSLLAGDQTFDDVELPDRWDKDS